MKRTIETRDYLQMVGRMIRAAARRVGEGDADELRELVQLRDLVDHGVELAVRDLRGRGWTWKSIGDATGTTPQAAIQKWL